MLDVDSGSDPGRGRAAPQNGTIFVLRRLGRTRTPEAFSGISLRRARISIPDSQRESRCCRTRARSVAKAVRREEHRICRGRKRQSAQAAGDGSDARAVQHGRSGDSEIIAPAMPQKYVYFFGEGHAEGNAKMKDVLGGKGAGLAEMTNIGVAVPPGFTISTEVCTYFYEHGKKYPPELKKSVEENLARVEKSAGKKFGDSKRPLLVSVRSVARASMPGMIDTILNLGLNDQTVQALAASADERFAYDSYRRFIQMYSDVVLNIDREHFEHELFSARDKARVKTDAEIPAEALKRLVETYKNIVSNNNNTFPQDVHEQLWGAINAVFLSGENQHPITHR